MTLRFRIALCWIMNVASAAAAVGAVMGNSPTKSHRAGMAAGLGFMIILNGWHWWMLQRIPLRSSSPGSEKPALSNVC